MDRKHRKVPFSVKTHRVYQPIAEKQRWRRKRLCNTIVFFIGAHFLPPILLALNLPVWWWRPSRKLENWEKMGSPKLKHVSLFIYSKLFLFLQGRKEGKSKVDKAFWPWATNIEGDIGEYDDDTHYPHLHNYHYQRKKGESFWKGYLIFCNVIFVASYAKTPTCIQPISWQFPHRWFQNVVSFSRHTHLFSSWISCST